MPTTSPLVTLTPLKATRGQLATSRGRLSVRPGQADYMEMSLIEISNYLQAHPFVRSQLGGNIDVSVNMTPDGSQLLFHLSRE